MRYSLFFTIILIELKTEVLGMLNITRKVSLDRYIGLPCQHSLNSHDTGSGGCKCNFEYGTFFSRNNATPSCIHNKYAGKMTGCKSGIQVVNATEKENVTLPCKTISIERIDLWEYVEETQTGIWDKKWNKIIHPLMEIRQDILHIKYDERQWDGLLLRAWVRCADKKITCAAIAFLGHRSYPLQNDTLRTESGLEYHETSSKQDARTWSFMWLIFGISIAGIVSIVIFLAVFIIRKKRRSKKIEINSGEKKNTDLPSRANREIERGVEVMDESNHIYHEIDEKYQHYKSFYKPLEPCNKNVKEPIYEEVEPEYKEIEPT